MSDLTDGSPGLDFVIGGAQKSASTFLQHCVATHPEIFMPRDEVAVFEDPEYSQGGPEQLRKRLKESTARLKGIKRPFLGKAEVPERLAAFEPSTKIIFVLRNPVERAISAYFHYVRGGWLPLEHPDFGLERLLSGTMNADYRRSHEILEFGLYGKHLAKFLDCFAKDQIMTLRHEDISSNADETLKTVYDFLGVDRTFSPPVLKRRPQAVVYNLTRARVLRARARIVNEPYAEGTRARPRKGQIYRKPLAGLISALDSLVLERIFGNAKPVLDRNLTARLIAFYAPDIELLGELLKRDFSDWTAAR